jgi:hypothetical protein
MLAELLAERGLRALGEVVLRKRGRRPEPDVLIILNGIRIVIEGKKPGMWEKLVKTCQAKLDNNVCDLCVMVEYADIKLNKLVLTQVDIKQALLKGRYNVGFMSYIDRIGLERWLNIQPRVEPYKGVKFEDLLTYLMSAYSRIISEDIIQPVIKRMGEVLSEFSQLLAPSVDTTRLRESLELQEQGVEEVE